MLTCNSASGVFEKDAYGIIGTSDPAFCYSILVTNCGLVDLENVQVIDDKLGNIGIIALLPVAGTFETNLVMSWHVTTTNTVTASGQSTADASTNGYVSADDFAIAHVRPASIECEMYISLDGGPWFTSAQLPPDTSVATPHEVVWGVAVTNTGEAAVEDITITSPSNECNVTITVNGITEPNEGTGIIPLCTNLYTACDKSVDYSVTVYAYIAEQDTNCVYNLDGSNVVVTTQCSVHLETCELPNGCRVTGGTRIDAPQVYPADIRYATHGGQVGAPFGSDDCIVLTNYIPGNPCIKGEWEHVRHMKGGERGNFHTRYFDTKACACLDTNVGPGGVYGEGTMVGDMCNPNDRASGPLPRKAPANKIAFSGIGDYALTKGKKEPQSVLFRVDIEDRSEPGGAHPKGGTPPPDRYRIRIWILKPSELDQLNNGVGPDPYLLTFRNAIAACNGINVRDGEDVPNGAPAFGVRPPDIDDGGADDNGNMQIHPSKQDCR